MAERQLHIPLEPVDSLTITTLVDNVLDVFMPDQDAAHRHVAVRRRGKPRRHGGQHGSLRRGAEEHRGDRPEPWVGCRCRYYFIRSSGIVAVVRLPGRDPIEIPTTSKAALHGAGFEIMKGASRASSSTTRCLSRARSTARRTTSPDFHRKKHGAPITGNQTPWCLTNRL